VWGSRFNVMECQFLRRETDRNRRFSIGHFIPKFKHSTQTSEPSTGTIEALIIYPI
jgi:hypothetical protein